MTSSAQARAAAHESWARTPDRAQRTQAGRDALTAKFEREARERLGPDASDVDVAKAAESARRAHYSRLSARGVEARKAAAP